MPVTDDDRRRIVAARQGRAMTVDELARRVGISRGTIYRIENGESKKTPVLPEIYCVLGLPRELAGKADPDDLELVELFRRLRQALLPENRTKYDELKEIARRWTAAAEAAREQIDAGRATLSTLAELAPDEPAPVPQAPPAPRPTQRDA